MFKLDAQFLKDLGLDELPADQKQAFLDHIYSQLELRVGTRLSDGLSDAQLAEFEAFVERDDEKVNAWLQANAPDYENDTVYQQLKTGTQKDATQSVLLAEYASLKWLGVNRPDYRDVVKVVLDEIKQEILSNRDVILGN